MKNRSKEFQGISLTFNTTEECNLRCKYCYEINKRPVNLKLSTAKKFIDLVFNSSEEITTNKSFYIWKEGVVLDFIGGDSFMNVELMEAILKYFIYKLYTIDNELTRVWRYKYRFSISTNGTLFNTKKVRDFCEKYKDIFSIGISIDGCPEIHDKNRIMLARGENGEEIGSMQYILRDWDWYVKIVGAGRAYSTKSTLSKDSIPYLYKSLVYMYEKLGINDINQNFIMEDAHLTEEDYIEFDKQMRMCVEYVLAHDNEIYWAMIDDNFSNHHSLQKDLQDIKRFDDLPTEEQHNRLSRCGSGGMPCLGVNGKIYPCFRWAPHTQTKNTIDKLCAGDANIDTKLNPSNFEKVCSLSQRDVCTKEERCKTCEYESACAYCIGGCYAENEDFIRTTHICEITKIQCKWAKVYKNEHDLLSGRSLTYDEKYLLKNIKPWTNKYLGTNLGE